MAGPLPILFGQIRSCQSGHAERSNVFPLHQPFETVWYALSQNGPCRDQTILIPDDLGSKEHRAPRHTSDSPHTGNTVVPCRLNLSYINHPLSFESWNLMAYCMFWAEVASIYISYLDTNDKNVICSRDCASRRGLHRIEHYEDKSAWY